MAKKKEIPIEVAGGDLISAFRQVMAGTLKTVSVDNMTSHAGIVGIPIQSIAFMYLVNSNVLSPRVIELTGNPKCCKSSLLIEMEKWVIMAGGQICHFETEGKENDTIMEGVMEFNPDYLSQVSVIPVNQYEAWVDGVAAAGKFYRTQFEAGVPNLPVVLAVDSLTAAPTAKMVDEVDKQGHTGEDYPRLPKALSNFFKTFAKIQDGWPFFFIFTNHSKVNMKAASMGLPAEDTPLGGKAVAYHKSLSIVCKKALRDGEVKANAVIRRLKLISQTNAMGPKRDIEIVVYFRTIPNPHYDPTSFVSEKYSLEVDFDWGETDIRFLDGIIKGNRDEFGAEKRRNIASILDMHIVSKANSPTWVWSPPLGIPEDAPVPFKEAGKRLLENEQMLRALQDELGIRRCPIYRGGMDYKEAVAQCIAERQRLITRVGGADG